ncbi:recombinase family protein [Bradyrhizobium sp. 166]|uniref:recombinase family protein n=1 Tax=Bradyrhizobium sp. 166 TaxID=2782638 RepID=UPI001FF9B2A0
MASNLNANGVRPPRGSAWNASTINGNLQRGGGILLNEIYAGRIVWNKVRMVKDPTTGRRLSRPNPKTEHRTADAPHLRIIDDATWQAAQQIKHEHSAAHDPTKGRPKRPFSGLIRCGSCGGPMVMSGGKNGGRVQCSAFKEKGTCKNGRRVPVAAIEALVLGGLRDNLADPAAIAAFVPCAPERDHQVVPCCRPSPFQDQRPTPDAAEGCRAREQHKWKPRRPSDCGRAPDRPRPDVPIFLCHSQACPGAHLSRSPSGSRACPNGSGPRYLAGRRASAAQARGW